MKNDAFLIFICIHFYRREVINENLHLRVCARKLA